MNFLAILLALAAQRALPSGSGLGEARLTARLLKLLRGSSLLTNSPALPWLISIAAVLLTAAADRALTGALPQLLFTAGILFLCLGPRELGADVEALIAAREGGNQAEAERLSMLLQTGPEPEASHRGLIGALFIQSHERLFGVLLWGLALGPAAAVGYRLVSRLPTGMVVEGYGRAAVTAADQLHAIAAWLPARLAAGLFALAGSMDAAIKAWKQLGEFNYSGAWRRHSWAVLAEVSAAALAMEEPEGGSIVAPNLQAALREVLRMQTRALLLLLAAFAIFTSGSLV